MGFSVGVISGPREDTKEEFDKRVAREMYSLCVLKNKKELNLEQFREEIKHRLNKENTEIHDILVYFSELSIEEKEELIDKCSVELTEKEKENSGKTNLLGNIDFKNFKDVEVSPFIPESYTRRDNFNKFVNSKMQGRKRRWT